MNNTYQLSQEQFNSLVKDSNIDLPTHILDKDLQLLKHLLVPIIIEKNPEITSNLVIEHYLNILLKYSDFKKNNISNNNDHKGINQFFDYFSNNDKYNLYFFFRNTYVNPIETRQFSNSINSLIENPHIFSNIEYTKECIETIKHLEQNEPLNVIEKDGILTIDAPLHAVLANHINQKFLITTSFAYDDYQKYNHNDNSIFDIQYDFPIIFDANNFTDDELKTRFIELLTDNSYQSLDFYDSIKNKVDNEDLSFEYLKMVAHSKNLAANLKFKLTKKIVHKDIFKKILKNELLKYENFFLNSDEKHPLKEYSTQSFSTELVYLFNISPKSLHSFLQDDSPSFGFNSLFQQSFKDIVNSDEFIGITKMIASGKINYYDTVSHIIGKDFLNYFYPFFPTEAKSNLSKYFIDSFLLDGRIPNSSESSASLHKRGLTNSGYETISIFKTIPFHDALINETLPIGTFLKLLELPNIDKEILLEQPQVILTLNYILHELCNITSDSNSDNNSFIESISRANVPKIIFPLLDELVTSGLKNPLHKFYNYPDNVKSRLIKFTKDNWFDFYQELLHNISFNYSIKGGLSEAIADVLHQNPNAYKGKASDISSFSLKFYTGFPPLYSIISEDFREIFVNGKIDKDILSNIIVKEHYLLQDSSNLEKLPLSIVNSQEFKEIVRTEQFFTGHTGGEIKKNFLLKIYNIDDGDFLLKQLFSEYYEHSIDFSKHNPELLTLIPQKQLDDPHFWIEFLFKEKSYLYKSFYEESKLFDLIPDKIFKNSIFIELFFERFTFDDITKLPKICFQDNAHVIKLLEKISPNDNHLFFESLLESKIPSLHHLYFKLNKGSNHINIDVIQHILALSNESILQKTIPTNKETKSKTLKF